MFLFNRSLLHPHKQTQEYPTVYEPLLLITFDDSSKTDYTEAYPIMSARGIKGTSYINGSSIGNSVKMSWSDVADLQASGVWGCECHGYTHTRWTDFTTDEARIAQLTQNDAVFIANGLAAPKHHAYPFGVSDAAGNAVIDQHRLSRRTTGYNMTHINDHETLSFRPIIGCAGDTVYGNTEKYDFNMQFIRYVYDWHKIGVFYFHSLTEDTESTTVCYKQYFTDFMDYIVSLGIRTLTIDGLYNEANA